jgi:hypothetical protein
MRQQAFIEYLRRPRTLTRTAAHLVFLAGVLPAATVVGTTLSLLRLPYYDVPLGSASAAALAGVALTAGDLLVAGSIVFGVSWMIFNRLGRGELEGRHPSARLALEPALTFGAVVCGAALWYPGLLGEPAFAPLGGLPAAATVLLIAAGVTAGAGVTGRFGSRRRLAALLLGFGIVSPAAGMLAAGIEGRLGQRPEMVVLGIDSLSYRDGLDPFRGWVESERGTWYERAVAPGLMTNAVWTSILTMEPVRQHGVFHTFQRFPARTTAAFMAAARDRGYRTVGYFPDQSTCAVGAEAGFEENRSGPVGWRQLLLPIVANSSVLVPLTRPALPGWWPSPLAANQAGSFTYDLRRDLRAILNGGRAGQRTLVAAHLTYLHLPAYPRSVDLSWPELRRTWAAPSRALRDRGLDWQDREMPGDPLPLRRWKLAYLRRAIASELRATGYLASGRPLVLFSDHGDRVGLTPRTFAEARYYHVLLATFGLPPRRPDAPTSLVDIGALVGFSDGRAEPAVEFAVAPPAMWPALVTSARLRWSGAVDLDDGMLAAVARQLRRHAPWPASPPQPEGDAASDGGLKRSP